MLQVSVLNKNHNLSLTLTECLVATSRHFIGGEDKLNTMPVNDLQIR